jgi:hypothetical protein
MQKNIYFPQCFLGILAIFAYEWEKIINSIFSLFVGPNDFKLQFFFYNLTVYYFSEILNNISVNV